MSIHSLLSRAKQIFIKPEDQAKLKALEDSVDEADAIRIAMNSDGGTALKRMLVNNFFDALDKLFKTREDRYISDLESIKNFIDKLDYRQEDSIKNFLEDRLKEYGN